MRTELPPGHPGELREEYMVPLGISINRLWRDLHVPPNRISEVVNQKRGITTDTALRLARYFATPPQFWLNLQVLYELEVSRSLLAKQIESEVKPRRDSAAAQPKLCIIRRDVVKSDFAARLARPSPVCVQGKLP